MSLPSPMRRFLLIALACAFVSRAANVPRPEFPEPQFERTDWMTLNGEWQFAFDDADAGLDGHWNDAAHALDRRIVVPYCFESKLSGIADTGFHPWIWYRREVTLPESWKTRRTLLHFGAVDYRAEVWVNGQMAASHEGGNTPFWFDVTPLVKPGANVITVRAWDPPQDKLIPRGKQYWEPKSKGIFYTRTSGIWQPVWLEAAGPAYLERIHIRPDPLGTVTFDGIVDRAKDGDQVRVSILDGETEISRGTADVAQGRASLSLRVVHPHDWSPEDPKLYNVTLEVLRNDQQLDRVRSYFGFRTVETRDGRVLLNGKPIYLKFVLDQGYWPESILTPPSEQAI
ncbi:MAG TPA: beta galactosidase jelly roll domain-containing protein, partial [Bryobacteraceae bacterium]|nr:beta galactosidase jelly roll domain-containing protein [Bryobacteraceae bacterium]